MITELVLSDNTRGALVGAGTVIALVLILLLAIFWPRRK
jgi:hypothetical protein